MPAGQAQCTAAVVWFYLERLRVDKGEQAAWRNLQIANLALFVLNSLDVATHLNPGSFSRPG